MSYDFGNLRVLILEDNKPMLEIIRAILFSFGVGEAYGVSNGERGYDLFREYEPDLIIADWMMSPGDGLSFTRKVRTSKDSPNPFVPIILITGFSAKKRVVSARDTGITEFLVKPFTAKDLYTRLVQIIERPRKFIRSDEFFGPDRRRSNKLSDYNGVRRRASDDEKSNNTVNLDVRKR